MLDGGAGDSRLDRNPPEYQDMGLVPGLGSLGSQTPENFQCSIRKDPPCGSGCAVLAGLFVSQDCSHYWNKIQQQHTAVLQMNLDMERGIVWL